MKNLINTFSNDDLLEGINQLMTIEEFSDYITDVDGELEILNLYKSIENLDIECPNPAEKDGEKEIIIATFDIKDKSYQLTFEHQVWWFYDDDNANTFISYKVI